MLQLKTTSTLQPTRQLAFFRANDIKKWNL